MATTPNSTMFYVYVLCRSNDRPFYVGKGMNKRVFDHEKEAKSGHKCHKCNVIRKIWRGGGQVRRYIVFTTTNEKEAFAYEQAMILLHGYEQLCNQTNGGEGTSKITDITRKKLSAAQRARWAIPEDREKRLLGLRRAVTSEEYRTKKSIESSERWADPAYHVRVSSAINAGFTSEVRAQITAKNKARYADPQVRAEQSTRQRAAVTPAFREKMSTISKRLTNTPERRKRSSEWAKAMWENPEQRTHITAAQKAAQSTPERRAYYSETQKAFCATPEGIEAKRRAGALAAKGKAVFTHAQGEEIKRLWDTGNYRQKDIATLFGVGQSSIGRVLRGEQRNWKDEDGDL